MCDSYSALLGWLSHARCPPPCPYSPGPGGHLPTRGASLLAPTPLRPGGRPPHEVPASLPLLPRPRRASCSPTRPFFRPPVAALGPPLAPLLAPSPPARRGGLATPPGQGAALLGPTSPCRCRKEEGPSRVLTFFYPSSEGGPFAYSAYSRSASRCPHRRREWAPAREWAEAKTLTRS